MIMKQIKELQNQLKSIKKEIIELRLFQKSRKVDMNTEIQKLENQGNEIIKQIIYLKSQKNQYFISFSYENSIQYYQVNSFSIVHVSDIDCHVNTRNNYVDNENELKKLINEINENYISDYMYRIFNIEIIRIENKQ